MNPQMRPYYRPRARMSISGGPASTATHRFSICQSPLSRPLTSPPPKRSYPEVAYLKLIIYLICFFNNFYLHIYLNLLNICVILVKFQHFLYIIMKAFCIL